MLRPHHKLQVSHAGGAKETGPNKLASNFMQWQVYRHVNASLTSPPMETQLDAQGGDRLPIIKHIYRT